MKPQKLYQKLIDAQELERIALKNRIQIEEKIFEAISNRLTKTEGSETIKDDGYSVTISKPVTYKLDDKKYRNFIESKSVPEEFQFHKVKLELDKKKYDLMLEVNSKYAKEMQDCVTAKPGKISVKIKKEEK